MPDAKQEWLQRFAQRHGRGAPAPANTPPAAPPPDVRPSQVIAGAAGPQDSVGDLTNQAANQGMDITEATRAGTQTLIDSNPMRSPELQQSGGFALRYGVGFLCINYTTMPVLTDISGYAQPTSRYRQAFSGMNRSQQYTDPRSADIRARIPEWIGLVASALPPGRAGELVVSFQGHGEQGGIFGIDGNLITASELAAFARQAEGRRVSLTYILDSCGSGNAVPVFQQRAAERVGEQTPNLDGRGNQSSAENHAAAETARAQLTAVRELIQMNRHVGSFEPELVAVDQGCRANNGAGTLALWQRGIALNQRILSHVNQMRAYVNTNLLNGSAPELGVPALLGEFDRLLRVLRAVPASVNQAPAAALWNTDAWVAAVGRLQDQISDSANRMIETLDRQTRAAAG